MYSLDTGVGDGGDALDELLLILGASGNRRALLGILALGLLASAASGQEGASEDTAEGGHGELEYLVSFYSGYVG